MNIGKTIAALTAAAIIPLSSAFPASSADIVVTPSANDVYVPDWVPDDLESAIKFHNTYGAVHIQGDYVCIVFPEDNRQAIKGSHCVSLLFTAPRKL